MTLPNFLIIGTQKAATTWLARRLEEHPKIWVAPREIHYFNLPEHHELGPAWYATHFDAAGDAPLVGEKTPAYFWSAPDEGDDPNGFAARMHALLPDAKLIVVLRDPVTRLISALSHHVRRRRVSPLVDPDELLFGASADFGRGWRLIDMGHYAQHLRTYRRYFAADQIKVVFYEDELRARPEETVRDCCRYLGADPGAVTFSVRQRENSSVSSKLGLCVSYYVPILDRPMGAVERYLSLSRYEPSPATKAKLYEHYRPLNEELFEMLGKRTDRWGGPAAKVVEAAA